MADTLNAMKNGTGVSFDLIVQVEGVAQLLTTGSTSAAVAAWAGTDHSTAIGNVMIVGGVEQRLEPWKGTPDVSRLSFAVMPTADTSTGDAFGRLAFGRGNGFQTYINGTLDCTATTVTVLSTSTFPASGEIHINTECITYTGKTATTFTGCTRGKYAPLRQAGTGIAHEHRAPVIADGGVTTPSLVTSKPREWQGRWVTVWAHRCVGGVLDTKAEAFRLWAGRIAGPVRDEPNGMTYIDCDSVSGKLRDTVMLRDQWTARVAEGIYLKAGWKFYADDRKSGVTLTATPLTVVSSGVGANEILEGTYTRSQLLDALNTWLAAEKSAATPRLNFDTTIGTSADRTTFTWTNGSTTELNFATFQAPNAVLNFLGFVQIGSEFTLGELAPGTWIGSGDWVITSPEEPFRIYTYDDGTGTAVVNVENVRGTWLDNQPHLGVFGVPASIAGSYALIQVNGGPMALFKYVSASTISLYQTHPKYDEITGHAWDEAPALRRVRITQTGDLKLTQCAVINTRFKWLMLMSLTSTGTANHNYTDPHAASHGDNFPAQLGAAIPWEYLGQPFYDSVQALDDNMDALLVVIDKPTKLTEVLGADLAARLLHLVWKEGGLVVRTWGTPTAAHAEHVFTDASKHAPAGTEDPRRTVAQFTDEFLKNLIKIEFNRVLSGGYQSSNTISDPSSQDSFGSQAITFSMRNTFAGISSTTTPIDEITDALAMSMRTFSRPLHILRRPISPAFYHVAPGDFCTITDTFTRDPATGARGLSNKPGLVTRVRFDWGGYEIDTGENRDPSGEVDILILPLSNISNYSPAAEVDDTTSNAGYVVATKVLTTKGNIYSAAANPADATHFDVGDRIYIHEVDPDNPAAPLAWSDVIAAKPSTNTMTLTTGLAGWDATKYYRVVSDIYTTAVNAQKADVYQADDADGMVADTVSAYVYGNDAIQAEGWDPTVSGDDPAMSAPSYRPRLYASTQYGDGRPLSTGNEYDLARLANSLVSIRTASLGTTMSSATPKTYTGAGRKIHQVQPIHIGPGDLVLGERYIRIGVWGRSTDGTSTTCVVSLCRRPPIGTSFTSDDLTALNYVMVGPYESQTSSAITATTYAIQAFNFSIRSLDPYTGIGYLVVEGASRFGTYGVCQIHPLHYSEVA